MPNHVHLVALPESEQTLARALGRAHWLYAQAFNRRHWRSGHLWQNRFYSCLLDEQHAWFALRYVERNPVRAGLAAEAWEYEWSSAAAHIAGKDPSGLLDLKVWETYGQAAEWRAALRSPEPAAMANLLRRRTHTGRALAGERLLRRLEAALGRRLRPLVGGRPAGSSRAGPS